MEWNTAMETILSVFSPPTLLIAAIAIITAVIIFIDSRYPRPTDTIRGTKIAKSIAWVILSFGLVILALDLVDHFAA